MRLFGRVDNQINRFDRAWWLTPPFDLEVLLPQVTDEITFEVQAGSVLQLDSQASSAVDLQCHADSAVGCATEVALPLLFDAAADRALDVEVESL